MDQAVENEKKGSSHEDQDERKSRQTEVLSTGAPMDQARDREQEFEAGTPEGSARARQTEVPASQLRTVLKASLQNSSLR